MGTLQQLNGSMAACTGVHIGAEATCEVRGTVVEMCGNWGGSGIRAVRAAPYLLRRTDAVAATSSLEISGTGVQYLCATACPVLTSYLRRASPVLTYWSYLLRARYNKPSTNLGCVYYQVEEARVLVSGSKIQNCALGLSVNDGARVDCEKVDFKGNDLTHLFAGIA
eukprot:3535788-Rhodomonas_salina.3